jgi:hypothetical protein
MRESAEIKLSRELKKRVAAATGEDFVDVVVRISGDPKPLAVRGVVPRPGAIAQQRQAFELASIPVEKVIEAVSGAITGRAWASRSVRARVPVFAVDRLAELDSVDAIDSPQPIRLEAEAAVKD